MDVLWEFYKGHVFISVEITHVMYFVLILCLCLLLICALKLMISFCFYEF